MQLLVSVRSAGEVEAALAGGADIIDAKEPIGGPLGAVSADVLAQILDRVPPERAVSIALGDVRSCEDVLSAVSIHSILSRPAPTYLKLGFAGVSTPRQVGHLLDTARGALRQNPNSPRLIAVAYADATRAGSLAPADMVQIAAGSGASGVLIDTFTKGEGSLLTWLELPALHAVLAVGRALGLLTAVAGGLGAEDLEWITQAHPHVVGFRGSACDGGREGQVSRTRVQQLRRALEKASSGFVQPGVLTLLRG